MTDENVQRSEGTIAGLPPVRPALDIGDGTFAAGPPQATSSEFAACPPPLSSQQLSSQPDDSLTGLQLLSFVNTQLERGFDNDEVQKQLVVKGHDPLCAQSIVRAVAKSRTSIVREAGLRNMFIGGGVCVVGLIVTVIWYELALTHGWTTYTIPTGAILAGALQFLYGLLQAIFGSR